MHSEDMSSETGRRAHDGPPLTNDVRSQIFHAVLTRQEHHATRCRTIMETWGSIVPAGLLTFYSNAPDPALPVIVHLEPARMEPMRAAQRRFLRDVLPHAAGRMRALNATWLMWSDDDTFVWPENLYRLLRPYEPQKPIWFGQACPLGRLLRSFCGGAGFAMSVSLVREVAVLAPRCAGLEAPKAAPQRFRFSWVHSDFRLAACVYMFLHRTVTDRREFNSQPPVYYLASEAGRRERPDGFGAAVTFHYLDGLPMRDGTNLSAAAHFQALWLLSRAAVLSSTAAGSGGAGLLSSPGRGRAVARSFGARRSAVRVGRA